MESKKYKLVTFGTEIGEGSPEALKDSIKHQNAIVRAFQAGSETPVKFSETLKQIDEATLEWKNQILIAEEDFETAIQSAYVKIGEILGRTEKENGEVEIKGFALDILNVEDVKMLSAKGKLQKFETMAQAKKQITEKLGDFEQTGKQTYTYELPVSLDAYEKGLLERDKKAKRSKSLKTDEDKGSSDNLLEDKDTKSKKLVGISLIIATLTSLVDITRRILTAVLDFGTDVKQRSEASLVVGTDYMTNRSYQVQEKAMGLPENIFVSGLQSIQSAFGNTADLDENAIAKLAPVVGNKLEKMITMGLGASNPKAIMELILDEFFKQGIAGVNSLGIQVGQVEAQRELTSALEKAGFSDLARVLNNMFYINAFGIHKGRLETDKPFESYTKIPENFTGGLTKLDFTNIAGLEQVVESLDSKFLQLGNNLKGKLFLALEDVLNALNNWTFGMSSQEKVEFYGSNREKLQQTETKMLNLRSTKVEEINKLLSSLNTGEVKSLTLQDILNFEGNQEITKIFKENAEKDEAQQLFILLRTVKEIEKRRKEAVKQRKSTTPEFADTFYTEGEIYTEAARSYFSDFVNKYISNQMPLLKVDMIDKINNIRNARGIPVDWRIGKRKYEPFYKLYDEYMEEIKKAEENGVSLSEEDKLYANPYLYPKESFYRYDASEGVLFDEAVENKKEIEMQNALLARNTFLQHLPAGVTNAVGYIEQGADKTDRKITLVIKQVTKEGQEKEILRKEIMSEEFGDYTYNYQSAQLEAIQD